MNYVSETIEISAHDNNAIKEKISELEKNMKRMDEKLDRILELLESDCKKMRDHIDFVETVYDNVKTPFNYVMDKVNFFVSNDNKTITDSIPKSDETHET